MFCILNNLALQKELQIFVTNNVFWTKTKNTTTTKQTRNVFKKDKRRRIKKKEENITQARLSTCS